MSTPFIVVFNFDKHNEKKVGNGNFTVLIHVFSSSCLIHAKKHLNCIKFTICNFFVVKILALNASGIVKVHIASFVEIAFLSSSRCIFVEIVKHIILSFHCKLLIIFCIKYNLSLMLNAFGVHANHSVVILLRISFFAISLLVRLCCVIPHVFSQLFSSITCVESIFNPFSLQQKRKIR